MSLPGVGDLVAPEGIRTRYTVTDITAAGTDHAQWEMRPIYGMGSLCIPLGEIGQWRVHARCGEWDRPT